MKYELRLSPKTILDKKFTKGVKGYKAVEVDEFLDMVIQDYATFEQYQKDVALHIDKLEEALRKAKEEKVEKVSDRDLKTRIRDLEVENVSLHKKLDGIKPGDNPSIENLQYIQRINRLEQYLHMIGVDPTTIR